MSNENRPTVEITTSWSKHKVVLREWITVDEFDSITGIFKNAATGARIDEKNKTADFIGNDAKAMIAADEKAREMAFNLIVVSIDEQTENLYKFVKENMRNEDGMQIFAKINEITSPKATEESVKPS